MTTNFAVAAGYERHASIDELDRDRHAREPHQRRHLRSARADSPLRRARGLARLGIPELRRVAALPLRYLTERRTRESAGRACAEDTAVDRAGIRRRQAVLLEAARVDASRRSGQRGRVARLCVEDDRGAGRGALPGAAQRETGVDRGGARSVCAPSVEPAARSASRDGRDHGGAAGRGGRAGRQGARSGARGGRAFEAGPRGGRRELVRPTGGCAGRARGGVDAVEEYFGSDASAEVPLDASAEVQLDASAEVSNCASAEAWRRPPTEAFSGVSRETPRVAVV